MTSTLPLSSPTFQAEDENLLLAALPPEVRDALQPHLELVTCGIKDMIYRPNEPITHVLFPRTGAYSILAVGDEEGELIEVATVGNENFVGLPLALGTETTPGMAFSQVPGEAWRMPAAAFQEAIAVHGALSAILNRGILALFTQIAQSAFCNRTHPMQQRCARWLLQTHDRVKGDEFPLTHEFLSQMLGVRCATVTEAIGPLQEAGLVRYTHGIVTVVDRPGLEAAACECYGIIVGEYRRLIGF